MKKILGIISMVFILAALTLGAIGCVSPTAFKIDITSPETGTTVSASPVTITGKVAGYTRGEVVYEDQTMRLAPEVTVNNIRTEVAPDGTFAVDVPMVEGTNTVKAVAMFNNLTVKDSIQIKYSSSVPELTVQIDSPMDEAKLTESPATVTGTVSDATATVKVNDADVEVNEDGNFTTQLALTKGENTITASAALDTRTAEDSVTVTYNPPTPTPTLSVDITSPANGTVTAENSIAVTGTVSNPAAIVKINGIKSVVAANGTFSSQVALNKGNNVVEAIATLDNHKAKDCINVISKPPTPILTVKINTPTNGAVLSSSPVEVTGTVSNPAATVKINNAAVTVAANGTFSTQVALVEGVNVIKANAAVDNLTAKDSVQVTYTPPLPPLTVKINSPANGATVTVSPAMVTGTVSEAAATVKINNVAVAVDANKNFSSPVLLTSGSNTITATATLDTRSAQDSITLTYAPPTLSVDITSPADGTVSTVNSVTINGAVSNPAAIVKVNTAAVAVQANGTFSTTVTLTQGENNIEAVATSGTLETKDSIKVTYTPPAPPLTIEINSPDNGETLTDSPVTVTGTVSEAGATVKVNNVEVTVDANKNFSTQVALTDGSNTITATATLDTRSAQDSVTVTYTPPTLTVEITAPEDGAVSATNTIEVTGTVSNPDAMVKINTVEVEVNADGTFTGQVSLVKGENTIEVVASSGDLEAEDSIKVNYAGPTLSLEVTTNPLNVTGKVSDPQANVTVNGVEAVVSENGTFSAQVNLVPGENTITVIATLDDQQTTYSFSVTYTPS